MKNQSNNLRCNYQDSPRYDYGYQSVHFNLKQQKDRMKLTQIMMAVTIDGTRHRIYIRNKVEPAFWDTEAGCCKDDNLLSPRVKNRMERLNQTLETIKWQLNVADMRAAEQGRTLTLDELRKAVLVKGHRSSPASMPKQGASGMLPRDASKQNAQDPVMILRSIADSFDNEISHKGGKGSASSRKTYLYCCQRLEEYSAYNRIEFKSFSQLDRSFYYGFAQWLNSRRFKAGKVEKHYCATTVQTTLRCISNLHRKAYDAGLTNIPECRCSAFNYSLDGVGGKIYLTEKELNMLFKLTELSQTEREIRDMFLIASYTGLRISDVNRLNEAVITDSSIRLFQQKTHGYVAIPLLKEIADIVESYAKRKEGFPKVNSSTANKHVKNLCKKAGIDSLTPVKECRGGVVISKNCPIYDLVSFHTARRSCVTNLFRRGYSPNYLMTMSGHKSVSSFQRYIRTDSEELSTDFIKELKKQKAL